MEDFAANPRYPEARRYVRDVRGFYTHALVFVLVNAWLFGADFLSDARISWSGWPFFGWGIGLLAHGLSVFAFRGWLGASWEERKIREYLERRP